MIFNHLFLQNADSSVNAGVNQNKNFSKSNYLFSEFFNANLGGEEGTKNAGSNSLNLFSQKSSLTNTNLELLKEFIFNNKIQLSSLKDSDTSQLILGKMTGNSNSESGLPLTLQNIDETELLGLLSDILGKFNGDGKNSNALNNKGILGALNKLFGKLQNNDTIVLKMQKGKEEVAIKITKESDLVNGSKNHHPNYNIELLDIQAKSSKDTNEEVLPILKLHGENGNLKADLHRKKDDAASVQNNDEKREVKNSAEAENKFGKSDLNVIMQNLKAMGLSDEQITQLLQVKNESGEKFSLEDINSLSSKETHSYLAQMNSAGFFRMNDMNKINPHNNTVEIESKDIALKNSAVLNKVELKDLLEFLGKLSGYGKLNSSQNQPKLEQGKESLDKKVAEIINLLSKGKNVSFELSNGEKTAKINIDLNKELSQLKPAVNNQASSGGKPVYKVTLQGLTGTTDAKIEKVAGILKAIESGFGKVEKAKPLELLIKNTELIPMKEEGAKQQFQKHISSEIKSFAKQSSLNFEITKNQTENHSDTKSINTKTKQNDVNKHSAAEAIKNSVNNHKSISKDELLASKKSTNTDKIISETTTNIKTAKVNKLDGVLSKDAVNKQNVDSKLSNEIKIGNIKAQVNKSQTNGAKIDLNKVNSNEELNKSTSKQTVKTEAFQKEFVKSLDLLNTTKADEKSNLSLKRFNQENFSLKTKGSSEPKKTAFNGFVDEPVSSKQKLNREIKSENISTKQTEVKENLEVKNYNEKITLPQDTKLKSSYSAKALVDNAQNIKENIKHAEIKESVKNSVHASEQKTDSSKSKHTGETQEKVSNDKNSVKTEGKIKAETSANQDSSKGNEQNSKSPDKHNLFAADTSKSQNFGDKIKADFSQHLSNNKSVEKHIKAAELVKEVSKFIQKGEKNTVTMRLSPAHLGKVKVTLDVAEQMVKAIVEVDNEQAKQLVQNQVRELQQNLNQQGIQLQSLSVSISGSNNSHKGGTKYQYSKKKDEGYNSEAANETEANEENTVRDLGYNTYEFFA